MKHAMVVLATGLAAGLALAGCVDHKAALTGTQSIGVDLVTPASPGDVNNRLPDGQRLITVNLTAYDANAEVDPTFDRDVDVYVQYLGTLTPSMYGNPPPPPLAKLHMTAGKAMAQTVMLPPVFGATTLWFDDHEDAAPTYATGTSPTLWFRDPTIADIQTPIDETALNALTDSPLENKQVTVSASRYGATGRLVVTSVFSQGYTVSDVNCADIAGNPPCTTDSYNHLEVFSFSAPTDQGGALLAEGQTIDGFSGGISEFDGLTEVGFPVTATSGSDATVVTGRLPAPVVFDPAWFGALSDPKGRINFERNEAAPIEVDNAKVCQIDDDFTTFGQWKIDPAGVGGDCSGNKNVLNVITAGVVADLDPTTLVGQTLPRVVGVVRPVEIGSFNVWIIYPRSAADLTLQ
jgi:hypothetical protein